MFVYSQRQNKVQRDSTCAFLSVSCTKNIDQHKSCYGFQDVGNEGHVFKARKHQENDDLGLAVEKHLSPKTLIGPRVSYRDFRETGHRAYKPRIPGYIGEKVDTEIPNVGAVACPYCYFGRQIWSVRLLIKTHI